MKTLLIAALSILTATFSAAQIVPAPPNSNDGNSYNGYIVNNFSISQSTSITLDLSVYDSSKVSAQVIYASSTPTGFSAQFLDGSQSTGNITVISYTSLSSASATNKLTVLSTASLGGTVLALPGYSFTAGTDWFSTFTASGTANNIANILKTVSYLSVSSAGAVVFTTATYGSIYNNYILSSSNSNILVASSTFVGGHDNAVITINGTALTQGRQWTASGSNATTAVSIAAAISSSAVSGSFAGVLISTVPSGNTTTVFATSTLNGSQYNYTLTSSTPGALSVSGPTFLGGTNAAFALGGHVFTSTAANFFTAGTPVLWAIGSNPAIGGLTTGTTYFVAPISATQFELAYTSTWAISGYNAGSVSTSNFVIVTGTNTQVVANVYTLSTLGFSGTPSFAWQGSNDNINWSTLYVVALPAGNIVTASAALTSSTPPTNYNYDFGFYNYRYLRFNIVKPTAGGMFLQSIVNIKQDGIGRY